MSSGNTVKKRKTSSSAHRNGSSASNRASVRKKPVKTVNYDFRQEEAYDDAYSYAAHPHHHSSRHQKTGYGRLIALMVFIAVYLFLFIRVWKLLA